MYYTDYSTVKINHDRKQKEFAQAAEADRLAQSSRSGSPTLQGLARSKLGNGLITMGTLLKDGRSSSRTAEPCR